MGLTFLGCSHFNVSPVLQVQTGCVAKDAPILCFGAMDGHRAFSDLPWNILLISGLSLATVDFRYYSRQFEIISGAQQGGISWGGTDQAFRRQYLYWCSLFLEDLVAGAGHDAARRHSEDESDTTRTYWYSLHCHWMGTAFFELASMAAMVQLAKVIDHQ